MNNRHVVLRLRLVLAVLLACSAHAQDTGWPDLQVQQVSPEERDLPPIEEDVPAIAVSHPAPAFSLISSQGDPAGLSLNQVLDLALTKSPRLRVARSKVGESQMRALASGLLPNPEIEAGAKRAREEGTGPILGIKQELPINGALGLERQAANFEYSASRADLQREIQIALGEVRTAYIEALSTRELKGIEEHGMQVASESLHLVSETLKAGLTSTLPYLLAQTEYANAKKSRQIADSNHRVARTRLARLLAMDESALPPLSGNLKETLVPAGSNLPIHSRPDLQASSLRVQSAQSSAASADRERIPNPVLGYSREETDESEESFFTLGLRVPLFNTGRPKVSQRLAEVQTAGAEKATLANTVQAEQEQAAARLSATGAAVQVYESEILPSVQRSLDAAGIAFQSGTTDLSLLLQTQSRLIEQERGYIRALEDLRKAESEYLLALGAPANR